MKNENYYNYLYLYHNSLLYITLSQTNVNYYNYLYLYHNSLLYVTLSQTNVNYYNSSRWQFWRRRARLRVKCRPARLSAARSSNSWMQAANTRSPLQNAALIDAIEYNKGAWRAQPNPIITYCMSHIRINHYKFMSRFTQCSSIQYFINPVGTN